MGYLDYYWKLETIQSVLINILLLYDKKCWNTSNKNTGIDFT